MLQEFLSPVAAPLIDPVKAYKPNQWGSLVHFHTEKSFPDLRVIKLAIFGVEEDRNATEENRGCQEAPDVVREALYQLYNWESTFQVADLGNIKAGVSQKDTYVAVESVVKELLQSAIIPIIIGGTHDVTYGQFMGHNVDNDALLNVVIFDEKIDLFNTDQDIDQTSFLYEMLARQSNLLNFSHVGYQRYLVDPSMLSTLEKLHFECYSLGEVRRNIEETEPIIRNAHVISFDISAIRYTEAPGTDYPSPHGFHGEEACRVARYAGLSDHVSSFGIYQFNPQCDQEGQTAMLIAQMVWYFVRGFYQRKYDLPEKDERDCLKYIVNFSDNDYEIQFLKSKKSDRWWMKIPVVKEGKRRAYHLLPCSYSDYEMACRDEIPDRWMKSYLRLSDTF